MNPTTSAPTPIATSSLGRAPSIISLILGISGLILILVSYGFFISTVAFVMLSIAVVIGVTGLILALTAKRIARANKARRAGTVTNIITIAWAIIALGGFAVIAVAGFLFQGGASTSTGARAASEAQINEPNTFAPGETAHIGAWDVKITKVTRDYQPTAEEYTPGRTSKSGLTDTNDEFVVVEGTKTPNGKTEAVYLEGGYLELNGSRTLPEDKKFLSSTKNAAADTYDFRFIFRIEQGSEALTLTYPVTVYKAISPIVGTEGMPREEVVYTLKLN